LAIRRPACHRYDRAPRRLTFGTQEILRLRVIHEMDRGRGDTPAAWLPTRPGRWNVTAICPVVGGVDWSLRCGKSRSRVEIPYSESRGCRRLGRERRGSNRSRFSVVSQFECGAGLVGTRAE
jgi:hypothetical protein